MNDDQKGSNPADRGGKVGRVIREYGLDGLGTELEIRWTGKGGDQYSLRALADRFNQRVLEAALEDAGVRSLEGDVENRYRLLTDDDVSAGMHQQARRELERAGVDVDALESDFVSHQSIYTYLTDHRGSHIPRAPNRIPGDASNVRSTRSTRSQAGHARSRPTRSSVSPRRG
ncbi:rod-determining factor RdfA [Halalkalicoccus salilacus]|uniref:rod-determining factor RdfA n=1 Tax=Halalkalicoccus sp. GCM10025704 TaxID=3252662 RepID=UPI0036185532